MRYDGLLFFASYSIGFCWLGMVGEIYLSWTEEKTTTEIR
jgi:hypothetical protein